MRVKEDKRYPNAGYYNVGQWSFGLGEYETDDYGEATDRAQADLDAHLAWVVWLDSKKGRKAWKKWQAALES